MYLQGGTVASNLKSPSATTWDYGIKVLGIRFIGGLTPD